MWQPKNRTFKQSMLDFNTAWAGILSDMVERYRLSSDLGSPVKEIPSQLIRPIHDRMKKNIVVAK